MHTEDSALRARVLGAAAALFAEHGFHGTTTRQIAKAAGVTNGGLYHHFRSKEDLLHEIYADLLRVQSRRLEAIASSDLPLPRRLHAIVADVVETTIANLDEAVVFFHYSHLLDVDRRERVRAGRRRYHERVRGLVAQGQAQGLFRADVPADIVVHHHFGAIHRIGTWYRADGPLPAARVARHFADLMLACLAPVPTEQENP